MCPWAVVIAPIFHRSISEVPKRPKRWVSDHWRRTRETRGANMRKRRERWISRRNSLLLAPLIRLVARSSAMCRSDPFCAFSIARPHRPYIPTRPIPGVPKPTKRCLLDGRADERRKREAPKCENHDKRWISARNTRLLVSHGPPSGCVGFRQIPILPIAAMSPIVRSPLSYTQPDQVPGDSKRPKRWLLGDGGGVGRRAETNFGNR